MITRILEGIKRQELLDKGFTWGKVLRIMRQEKQKNAIKRLEKQK